MNRQATQEQVILIKISALLIAIKANHGMDVRVATEIATQACAEFNVLPHELASMETEIRQTLNGHVNAPTVHVFLNAYTPLMTNINFILDISRFHLSPASCHCRVSRRRWIYGSFDLLPNNDDDNDDDIRDDGCC